MKNTFNLLVAFSFGVATLAACQKVVETTNAPVPAVAAQSRVPSVAPVSGPTTQLERMGAVRVKKDVVVPIARPAHAKAHQAKVALGKGTTKSHSARARADQAEADALEKAGMNEARVECLRYIVDYKVALDVRDGVIRDFGSAIDAPVCAPYRT